MADLNEVIVDWSSAKSPGGLSGMYFLASGSIANQRSAIQNMYTACIARLDNNTSWSVRTSGKVIDEATGTLTAFWNDNTTKSGSGTLTGNAVPNAAQVLLRWRTTQIVNGRLLQGRTFVPGLSASSLDEGEVSSAAVGTFQTAQGAFIAAVPGEFVVWHRPNGASPGAAYPVTGQATWAELAVQRRRR